MGTRHLHRDYSFTGSLVETAPKSLRHSCRSELTRQGISLEPYSALAERTACLQAAPHAIPACRHADGTISSSGVPDVRRMVSEDSHQVGTGLPPIHRL